MPRSERVSHSLVLSPVIPSIALFAIVLPRLDNIGVEVALIELAALGLAGLVLPAILVWLGLTVLDFGPVVQANGTERPITETDIGSGSDDRGSSCCWKRDITGGLLGGAGSRSSGRGRFFFAADMGVRDPSHPHLSLHTSLSGYRTPLGWLLVALSAEILRATTSGGTDRGDGGDAGGGPMSSPPKTRSLSTDCMLWIDRNVLLFGQRLLMRRFHRHWLGRYRLREDVRSTPPSLH